MNEEDNYTDALNSYILSNFQKAIKSIHRIQTKNASLKQKADVLMYLIYIGQRKFSVVLNEIPSDSDNTPMKLVRMLALVKSKPSESVTVLENVQKVMNEITDTSDDIPFYIASVILMHYEAIDEALKILHSSSGLLCDATRIQCMIKNNSISAAGKLLRRMITVDEDSIFTQVSAASFYLCQGGEKLTESLNIYQELEEKFGKSVFVLNGQAQVLLSMGRFDEADSVLKEALDIDPDHEDTLFNMQVISHHLGKPAETVTRYLTQLQDINSENENLLMIKEKEAEFDRCKMLYAPSVAN